MTRHAFKMQLRKGFETEYKRRHDDLWPEMLAELEAGGLVEVSGWRVRPTARGMLVADSIAAALLGAPPRRLHCD